VEVAAVSRAHLFTLLTLAVHGGLGCRRFEGRAVHLRSASRTRKVIGTAENFSIIGDRVGHHR